MPPSSAEALSRLPEAMRAAIFENGGSVVRSVSGRAQAGVARTMIPTTAAARDILAATARPSGQGGQRGQTDAPRVSARRRPQPAGEQGAPARARRALDRDPRNETAGRRLAALANDPAAMRAAARRRRATRHRAAAAAAATHRGGAAAAAAAEVHGGMARDPRRRLGARAGRARDLDGYPPILEPLFAEYPAIPSETVRFDVRRARSAGEFSHDRGALGFLTSSPRIKTNNPAFSAGCLHHRRARATSRSRRQLYI